jgi:hypothetical protein
MSPSLVLAPPPPSPWANTATKATYPSLLLFSCRGRGLPKQYCIAACSKDGLDQNFKSLVFFYYAPWVSTWTENNECEGSGCAQQMPNDLNCTLTRDILTLFLTICRIGELRRCDGSAQRFVPREGLWVRAELSFARKYNGCAKRSIFSERDYGRAVLGFAKRLWARSA